VVENGIWNDMNEPAVFNAPEKTFPRDAVHFSNVEHRLVHNAYGFMQTKGTFDGLTRRSGGKLRPFILTRSFFAGSQKYTAVWTGDNTADWGYLKASIHACLAISVAGILLFS
jgi:alpha 1,3-glucosidase